MVDLKRFLELIEKADEGLDSGCLTTATAYWRMATLELLQRISEVRDPAVKASVDAAYAWISRFTSKPGIRMSVAIGRSASFWYGYDAGQRGGTLPGNAVGSVYRRGFRFAYEAN